MSTPPADRPDAGEFHRADSTDDELWGIEAAATALELSRRENEKLLLALRRFHGFFLPTLYLIWFVASLAIVFLSGFALLSFDVPTAVEISAYTSLSSGVAIPLALVVRAVFRD